jgi:hypothetical protein
VATTLLSVPPTAACGSWVMMTHNSALCSSVIIYAFFFLACGFWFRDDDPGSCLGFAPCSEVFICMYVCVSMYVCVCMYVCMYMYIYIYIYMYVYVCVCVCVCVCVSYIYI